MVAEIGGQHATDLTFDYATAIDSHNQTLPPCALVAIGRDGRIVQTDAHGQMPESDREDAA